MSSLGDLLLIHSKQQRAKGKVEKVSDPDNNDNDNDDQNGRVTKKSDHDQSIKTNQTNQNEPSTSIMSNLSKIILPPSPPPLPPTTNQPLKSSKIPDTSPRDDVDGYNDSQYLISQQQQQQRQKYLSKKQELNEGKGGHSNSSNNKRDFSEYTEKRDIEDDNQSNASSTDDYVRELLDPNDRPKNVWHVVEGPTKVEQQSTVNQESSSRQKASRYSPTNRSPSESNSQDQQYGDYNSAYGDTRPKKSTRYDDDYEKVIDSKLILDNSIIPPPPSHSPPPPPQSPPILDCDQSQVDHRTHDDNDRHVRDDPNEPRGSRNRSDREDRNRHRVDDKDRSSSSRMDKHKDHRERDHEKERDRDKDRHRSNRDKDRDRERGRDRRGRHRSSHRRCDYSDDEDRHRSSNRRRRSHSKSSRTSPTRSRHRSRSPNSPLTKRNSRTILIMQLSPRVDTTDLEEFFGDIGRVREVRLIMDSKTRRHKGIAYIEFESSNSASKALELNGQKLFGAPVVIQSVQSDRARPSSDDRHPSSSHHHSSSYNYNATTTSASYTSSRSHQLPSNSYRVYVGGLNVNLTEEMIRSVFEPFGPIIRLELMRDRVTNLSRGYAFITYADMEDGQNAVQCLDGFALAGKNLRVSKSADKNERFANSGSGEQQISMGTTDIGGSGHGSSSTNQQEHGSSGVDHFNDINDPYTDHGKKYR